MRIDMAYATGFYGYEQAISVAAELADGDHDWTYQVVDCKNGLGRIDVYDEDGELVVEGFNP